MSGLAIRNQVNANPLRRWMQLHGKRTAHSGTSARLLPVTVIAQEVPTNTAPSKADSAVEMDTAGAVLSTVSVPGSRPS